MSFRFIAILLSAALCSCASVSLKKAEQLKATPPTRPPEKIFVKPFSFYEPALRVDRSGKVLEEFKYNMQEKFTRNLVKRLSRSVAPAEAVAATAPLPRGNYWLVTGRFDKVNQGSRIMRSVIGFGIGGTKLDTSVVIYDLSGRTKTPLLLIETTGGSNASPGAIGSVGYFVSGVTALGSVANLLEGVRSGITFDIVRTTREVTATAGEYLYQQGAVKKNPDRPKRVGTLPYFWWPFHPKDTRKGAVTVTPAE
jgi:hypothetical protein